MFLQHQILNDPSNPPSLPPSLKLPQSVSQSVGDDNDVLVEEDASQMTASLSNLNKSECGHICYKCKSMTTHEQSVFFKSGKDAPKVQERLLPAKCLNMRTECIDQLDKWHSLMERGGITAEQYKEYQDIS